MKKDKAKKEKRVLTYEEKHNRYLGNFKKFASVLIWVGVLNVVSLIVALIQAVTGQSAMFFTFCFGFSNLSFRLLGLIRIFHEGWEWLYYVLVFVIAIIFSSISIIIGVFSGHAKKRFLWLGFILYTIDTLAIIPCRLFLGENDSVMWMMFLLHVIVLGFIAYAIIQYYRIVDLAIRHQKIQPLDEKGEEQNASHN